MELTPQQQAMAQANQQAQVQQMQQQMQVDFTVMQIKINLLAIAKDIVATQPGDTVQEVYLDLREEVLGIPNPNKEKEDKPKAKAK